MQRNLVWKKLVYLLSGVTMTAVWRRRVDNQSYIRNYPRLGTPVAETACLHVGEDTTRARPDTPTPCSDPRGSVHRGAASFRPAPSDAANPCLLHVGENMTRARPDTPTPCSDPQGLRASRRGLIQTGSVRRRESMPCVACDSVGC